MRSRSQPSSRTRGEDSTQHRRTGGNPFGCVYDTVTIAAYGSADNRHFAAVSMRMLSRAKEVVIATVDDASWEAVGGGRLE